MQTKDVMIATLSVIIGIWVVYYIYSLSRKCLSCMPRKETFDAAADIAALGSKANEAQSAQNDSINAAKEQTQAQIRASNAQAEAALAEKAVAYKLVDELHNISSEISEIGDKLDHMAGIPTVARLDKSSASPAAAPTQK